MNDRDKTTIIRRWEAVSVTINLTKEEADILYQDIIRTLEGLTNQKEDLEACAEFLESRAGKDNADQSGIIIKRLKSDILFTQGLIDSYQKDLQDLRSEQERERDAEILEACRDNADREIFDQEDGE